MEEKARLSREQEMHQRYKSQPPLSIATTSSGMSAVTKSSVRDLSSTLLNTSVNLQSSSSGVGTGSPMMPGAGSSTSGVCWGTTPTQSWNGQAPVSRTSAPARTVDMSSLDNILPMGGKPRPTLNSMAQPAPAPGPNPFGTPPARMPAAFGQPPMMIPGVPNQMGIPSPFGGVRPMTLGNPGMMGGVPVLAPQQSGILQNSQQPSTNALSNKDIADLIG